MGSHRTSIRREIRSIERGLRQFQREVGTYVYWYEFDQPHSGGGDTYSEGGIPDPFDTSLVPSGPGEIFRPPVGIPVVWFRFTAPGSVQTDSGEYTINRTNLRISVEAMRRSGLRQPMDPAFHFNDRYAYNGFLYRVEAYSPRGWLHDTYLMVDVQGREMKEEEFETDVFPIGENPLAATAWTPGQLLDWQSRQPGDWETQSPDG